MHVEEVSIQGIAGDPITWVTTHKEHVIDCAVRSAAMNDVLLDKDVLKIISSHVYNDPRSFVVKVGCADALVLCNECGLPRRDCPVGAKTKKRIDQKFAAGESASAAPASVVLPASITRLPIGALDLGVIEPSRNRVARAIE